VTYTNETLVRNGYLGASPEKPTLAISIELLEIYRQLCRVCPRFSLDALARALCHIHHVRISLYYRRYKISNLFHRFLVIHTSLTRSVLHMTASSKSNLIFENDTMRHLDEVTDGSRKMFARRACIKLKANRPSSSVFWQPWTGTTPSNSLTVHSVQDQNELIIEPLALSDGSLPMMLTSSRTK
jgi:hypothetical protein